MELLVGGGGMEKGERERLTQTLCVVAAHPLAVREVVVSSAACLSATGVLVNVYPEKTLFMRKLAVCKKMCVGAISELLI